MNKWEYAVVRINHRKRTYTINGGQPSAQLPEGNPSFPLEIVLGDLGSEGWELVHAELSYSMDKLSVLLFKRPGNTG